MPPKPIFDFSLLGATTVIADREAIYSINPHRFEFQQLDGVYLCDFEAERMAGYRDVRDDEFWVRGHIPGRPIFPGVLMIETAAQLVSYFMMQKQPDQGFLAFGGVDRVKFRGAVVPGDRIVMLGEMIDFRRRRCVGSTQGYVNGTLVYEGIITGMWM